MSGGERNNNSLLRLRYSLTEWYRRGPRRGQALMLGGLRISWVSRCTGNGRQAGPFFFAQIFGDACDVGEAVGESMVAEAGRLGDDIGTVATICTIILYGERIC